MLQKTSTLLAGLIISAASFAQIADKTPKLNAGGVISENVVGKRDAEDAITANYMKYNITPNRPNGRNGQPMNVIERGACFPDYNGVMR